MTSTRGILQKDNTASRKFPNLTVADLDLKFARQLDVELAVGRRMPISDPTCWNGK